MNEHSHHALQRFAAIQQTMHRAPALTMLHIGDEESVIVSGALQRDSDEPPVLMMMPIGAVKSARELLRHTPPRPREFELAIEPIEDEITRHHRAVRQPSLLVTESREIKAIALLAGVPESREMVLSIDAMEGVFSRLAAVIQGQPAHTQAIPEDNVFAMRLLILREFMHHVHFEKILILT